MVLVPNNSLFKQQIKHYKVLLGLKEELIKYYESEKNKAESIKDYAKVKLCIRMLSQVRAEHLQTKDAIYYWGKEEEEYFRV